jgi:hypothetical protein
MQKLELPSKCTSMMDIWVYQACNCCMTISEKLEKTKYERKIAERL